MSRLSRRQLVRGALGLSVAGAGGLLLHPQAHATPASGTLGTYADFLVREAKGVLPDVPKSPGQLVATEDNILGPYYRAGAPFRAKITPPLEPGKTLLI